MNAKETKLLSIDVLKGISIIFVVLTHVNMTAQQKTKIYANFWILAAVSIFMIISAYNYSMRGMKNYYAPKVFLPRLMRILLPWIITLTVEIFYLSFFANSKLSVHKIYFLLPFSKKLLEHTNLITSICFDVLVCVAGGCIFYLAYSRTVGRWMAKVHF